MSYNAKAAGRQPGGANEATGAGGGVSPRAYSTPKRPGGQGPVFVYDAKGRRVASVICNELRITAHGRRHMLRCKPGPGWAFSQEVIERARELGAERIVIKDADTGNVYRATLDALRELGIGFNLGHGWQVCLPLSLWAVSESPKAVQPPLFQELDYAD